MSDGFHRRSCDTCHESPCEKLRAHSVDVDKVTASLDAVLAELKLIREDQKLMKDIIVAAKNVKGFIATMRTVAIMLGWMIGFVAIVGGFTELVRHWLGVR